MGRLKAPMPVSFLVQDRESCIGMAGSPLHSALEVICKILVRDYVWRRLSSMLLHANWILKWNNPQEAITKILSTNWILIDPSPGQPKVSRRSWSFPRLNASAVSAPGYRGSCTAINAPQLPTSLVLHARHSLTSLGLAGSWLCFPCWWCLWVALLALKTQRMHMVESTWEFNSYGDVVDDCCLHALIWELLACWDFGVPRRCRKDCTVESCRTWLVESCPQRGRVSE